MAEWMKFYTQYAFSPSRGLFHNVEINETTLATNPLDPNGIDGLAPIRDDRNILKLTHDTGVENEIFGTTLMALCFSKYESVGVPESFKKLCRDEYKFRCSVDQLKKFGINLYFCDKVQSPDLLAFFRNVPVHQIKKALDGKDRIM
jgi:hypothetical protein